MKQGIWASAFGIGASKSKYAGIAAIQKLCRLSIVYGIVMPPILMVFLVLLDKSEIFTSSQFNVVAVILSLAALLFTSKVAIKQANTD